MRSDKDEVFRFLWENRKDLLELRDGAYTEVLSVRPCVRIGPTASCCARRWREYYQVARLTRAELRAGRHRRLPKEYLAALREERRDAAERRRSPGARRRWRRPPAGADDGARPGRRRDGHDAALRRRRAHLRRVRASSSTASTTTCSARRQARRLEYLWEAGQLEPGLRRARLQAAPPLDAAPAARASTRGEFPRKGGSHGQAAEVGRDPLATRSASATASCSRSSTAHDDKRHVLIDFGTTELPTRGTPRKAAKASEHMPAGRERHQRRSAADSLTAVVATHRHADHISGFGTDGKTGKSGEIIRALQAQGRAAAVDRGSASGARRDARPPRGLQALAARASSPGWPRCTTSPRPSSQLAQPPGRG